MAKWLTNWIPWPKRSWNLKYFTKKQVHSPQERKKPKDYEDGQIEKILSLILHKVEEHDRVLKDIKENVLMINNVCFLFYIY